MKNNIFRIGLPALIAATLTFSCQGSKYKIKETESSLLNLESSLEGLSELESYIAPYKDSLNAQMNQIIGQSGQKLTKGIPESLLTNFTTDLLLEETKAFSEASNLPIPEVALINHKGLRTIIDEGPITVNTIFRLMPFENEVVLLTLSKEQLIELFDYMASVGGDGLAGASFVIADGKASDMRVAGQSLTKDSYIVATSDYLANGGDHYTIFKSAQSRIGTGLKLRDVIIAHISKVHDQNSIINSELDNRISYATK